MLSHKRQVSYRQQVPVYDIGSDLRSEPPKMPPRSWKCGRQRAMIWASANVPLEYGMAWKHRRTNEERSGIAFKDVRRVLMRGRELLMSKFHRFAGSRYHMFAVANEKDKQADI
jgi:hypothetical protein